MNDEQKRHLHALAANFRDYADRDYIAARTLYRYDCLDQFLYLAHQAIEKYLKSILLFNYVKRPRNATGGKWHDLNYLYHLCKSNISYFQLHFDSEELIDHLSSYNLVRYPDFPFHGKRESLLLLDKLVWQLRFFCHRDPVHVENLVKTIGWEKLEQAKYRNIGNVQIYGYVEDVLKNRNNKHGLERQNLIWKNFYYGKRRKKSITFRGGFWSKNNHLFALSPQEQKKAYEAIKDYIFLPTEAHDYFKNL